MKSSGQIKVLTHILLILVVSISQAFAKQKYSEVPIIGDYGLILGEELDKKYVAKEIVEPKQLVGFSHKYIANITTDDFDVVEVLTTNDNLIYKISANKRIDNCHEELVLVHQKFGSTFKIDTELSMRFVIENEPTKTSQKSLTGLCSLENDQLFLHYIDRSVSDNVNKQASEKVKVARDKYVRSLPHCRDGYLRPIKRGWTSSRYGRRKDPFTKQDAWHNEIDFAGKLDSLVYASNDGVVTLVAEVGDHGKRIEIDHQGGRKTTYSQLNAYLISEGDVVVRGQPIARLGSTGRSTGPHVGFGLMVDGSYVNPSRYLIKTEDCNPGYKDL